MEHEQQLRTYFRDDLEIGGQGQGDYTQTKAPALVCKHVQYLLETPNGH